jgi:UDP-N-acetylmuramate dehydrogenase
MAKLHYNINLQPYHTFGIKEFAAGLFEFENPNDLKSFILSPESKPFRKLMPIGTGSNLLFTKKFEGCLLHSIDKSIEKIEIKENIVLIKTGAGIEWDDFVQWAVNENLYGIENLSLIPGTTGATPVQNIGAYGVEIKDFIVSCTAMDLSNGVETTFKNDDIQFDYRDSIFKNELKDKYFITSVTFKLYKEKELNMDYGSVKNEVNKIGEANLQNIRQAIINIRNSKLPDHKILGNAGSFFKNPIVKKEVANELLNQYPDMPSYEARNNNTKLAAGWLIDQCGLKGYKMDSGAAIHDKQALVIINRGVSTGGDIAELADFAAKRVLDKFGVALEAEVKIM